MTQINKFQPLVTVYIPTYNRIQLLQRAIDSVFNQDYENIEIIVVDDKSTDQTHEYLEKLAKENTRFKYFINTENAGACFSRNKAIFAANGEFITGLDDDDYFMSNHISSFLNKWQQIDGKSEFIALYPNTYIKNSRGIHKSGTKILSCNARDLICSNWIGNQIFTRTDSLKKINAFDKNLKAWQDLECWYSLLKTYNKKAVSTEEHSYVVDISHPHERISTGKIESVRKSFEYFCVKHKLSENEKRILQLQVNYYTKEVPNLTDIIRSVIYVPKSYNFKRSFIRFFGPIIRKIK